MTSDIYDFSKLRKYTKALQEMFTCSNCNQEYSKKWCKDDAEKCFFCKNLLPMRDTYNKILKNIEWYYYRSGETSQKEYYNEFLDNLQKWCKVYSVYPTKEDIKIEEEIRGIQDWTRDYWH